jgi:cell wall-associated NlpC family hydrolase
MTTKKTVQLKQIKRIVFFAIVLGLIAFVISLIAEKDSVMHELNATKKSVETDKKNVSLRDSIVEFGMQYLGKPYIVGASCEEGFDCSGFVYFVFKHFKIEVPRSSIQFADFGKEISIESVKKGDILVFLSPTKDVIGHVGIVTKPKGMESDFIHASSGDEMQVIISSIKEKGYTKRFVKAVDVLE